MAELEEVRKMNPQARIKRLKEIEESNKKEIEDAEKLIKDSEGEIEAEEKLMREVPVPQMQAVDIDHLFTREEKEVFEVKRGAAPKKADVPSAVAQAERPAPPKREETLEDAVGFNEAREGALDKSSSISQVSGGIIGPAQQDYISQLAMVPFDRLQEEAQGLYSQFKAAGYATQGQQERAGQLYGAFAMKEDAAKSGSYNAAESILEQIDPLKRMLGILGGYKR